MHDYNKVFLRLYAFIKSNNFSGYDPYDFMASPLARKRYLPQNRSLIILLTQLFRYSPVNFRKFLRIEKRQNLKTLVLTARSIINYFEAFGRSEELEKDLQTVLTMILKHAQINNSFLSWGRIDYDYYSTTGLQKKESSLIYLTALAGYLFVEAYEYYRLDKYLAIAEKVGDFLSSIPAYEENDSICFYYTTTLPNKIYNASAHACAFLGLLYRYLPKEEYLLRAKKGFSYIEKVQNGNGSWNYGVSQEGKQLLLKDYHQGFILDSYYYYLKNLEGDKKSLASYKKGLDFYALRQFDPNGKSAFRYPRVWPADIHNQAQGIITFYLAGSIFPEFERVCEKITQWTLSNMYGLTKGYFYYQKWPMFTNKIPYMRWNQAWMLYALSHLIGTPKLQSNQESS